jgi:Arc/MetJ-type ribon-helix-helix transcriptional regulator
MKHKICISVDEETLLRVREKIRTGKFRNRSHAFEYAIQKEFLDIIPSTDTEVEE